MYTSQLFLAVLAAVSVSAVPLNINLGAYSPALVVGDGEISFGGAQNAGELIETLATGAANRAGAAPAAAVAAPAVVEAAVQPAPVVGEATERVATPPVTAEAAIAAPVVVAEASTPIDGVIGNRVRDGLNPALLPLSPADDAVVVKKRALIDLASLEARSERLKRDLNGFREALGYAREAMKNSPKIELGSEEAGVGIVVNGGVNVPVSSAANGAHAKRSLEAPSSEAPRGITLVAIAEI